MRDEALATAHQANAAHLEGASLVFLTYVALAQDDPSTRCNSTGSA